jgi:hypothetical protein
MKQLTGIEKVGKKKRQLKKFNKFALQKFIAGKIYKKVQGFQQFSEAHIQHRKI